MTETKSENCDLDALMETVSDKAADKWDEEFEHASRQLSEAYENLDPETKAWLEQRKEAAKSIDAETAEVNWMYAQTLDPYGVIKDFPEALYQIGREYFARAPGKDIWVEFEDLPESVREKLWEMHQHKLAFPAGLSDVLPWEDTAEFCGYPWPEPNLLLLGTFALFSILSKPDRRSSCSYQSAL